MTELPMRLWLPLLLVLSLVSAPAFAQAEDAPRESFIWLDRGSDKALPLGLPPLVPNGDDAGLGSIAHGVIRADLGLSAYFSILDPKANLEAEGAGVKLGEFDFEAWRTPGAVGLAKATVTVEAGRVAVELHVYDVDAGVEVLARRISGAQEDIRYVAHRVANAIVEAFTGSPGIFDTRIVAVADFGRGKEVYVLDYDGASRRGVSRNGSINLSPAWSADGKKISYTSYRDNNPDLWVTNLETGRHSKISSRPGLNSGGEWSGDGTGLVLTLSKDRDSEIYMLDPEGSILSRLTRQLGIDVSPTFSPDSRSIAFVSSRNGTPQIFLMNRDGSDVRRLTHLGGHNVSPAFSPDGLRIAFAGRDEGRFDIFVMDIDGSGIRRLTQSPGDDEDPTWSPDGRHILFSSSREGSAKQLYVMSADGRDPTRITDGAGSYSNPMWGPRP
jgi:TolB protein